MGLALGAAAARSVLAQRHSASAISLFPLSPPGDSLWRGVRAPNASLALESTARKSYVIPALEIVGFQGALNLVDRIFVTDSTYHVSWGSITRHLHRSWVVDNDPFKINQFGHPFQGSMYHGFARSVGLNYWTSLGYTFAGSALWEIAGETTAPSKNDQIASGIAGTFLGEALFRMASLLLETPNGSPGFWRTLAAGTISPAMGFNRATGNRFDGIFDSRGAAYYRRWQFGVSATTQNEAGASTRLRRNEGLIDLSMDYGLPGKPGYDYRRPFDYFTVRTTGSSANGFENILTRGLLVGRRYQSGNWYRGVWGLYGSYDYVAPQVFRISTTALSLGTTGQWWLSHAVALQGTAMSGMGYAAVGTLHGTNETDYHYGIAPQAVLSSRFIFGDRASIELTGREYFVSNLAPAATGGHDNILRGDASFAVRIHRQRAIAVKYVWSRRDALYPGQGTSLQLRGTVGIFYTLLGHDRFGAVDWR